VPRIELQIKNIFCFQKNNKLEMLSSGAELYEPKIILGIETSCDETAAAVVLDGRTILGSVVASQVEIHSEYGGIVPEIASRKHVEAIYSVVNSALEQAGVSFGQIDGIAVTQGPGLVGSLVVGLSFAKAAAVSSGIPLTGVNHVQAHLLSVFLSPDQCPAFPFIGLVVSGGHTSLYLVRGFLNAELLGQTRDDAAGEAFDKVAKVLGLPYPGGPVISELARKGARDRFAFPRARLPETPFDFSFSGLKTAVMLQVRRMEQAGENIPVPDVCASFEEAVVDILVRKTIFAAGEKGVKDVAVAGGVASNRYLREQMSMAAEKKGLGCIFPEEEFCTDNAAMIALAGYHQLKAGITLGADADVYSRLPV